MFLFTLHDYWLSMVLHKSMLWCWAILMIPDDTNSHDTESHSRITILL